MLTTGIVPSLNVSAGLLGFFFVRTWTAALGRVGLLRSPFTRQENTVIQTCVVAASGIAYSGGFGSYLFAMSETIAKQSTVANDSLNIKNPRLGWMIGFLFVVSFLGLFSLVPLRKIMIIDYKLTYPSGTATANLINSFHTPQGANLAKKQVRTLGKLSVCSFLWGFFQWFYTGGKDCGFINFPSLGLKAYDNMYASQNLQILYDIYLIRKGLQVLGFLRWGRDDLPIHREHICALGRHPLMGNHVASDRRQERRLVGTLQKRWAVLMGSKRRTQLFLQDQIPKRIAYGGYLLLAAVSTATLPHIFPQLRWYYVLVAYVFALPLTFCNGLIDWPLALTYGKLAIFAIGGWAGAAHGDVLVGLAACGVMINIVSTASDLMQDFKTGYLTLASPRSMFISQVIGTAMGCVIAPSVFWLFLKAFDDIGIPGSEYPAPNALVYRNMAILGVEGFSSLPKNCLTLCYVFFAVVALINLLRDVTESSSF
ncbi:hypothetical protein OPV22_028539 [Ensete ventricosum]|uniref:Uncharacterized protein n=1 Tax=Ensete ventricosum TaxID=4639 RepID=A0AAV8P6H0_ENSVE|nr:hypothetical protein OPV22_028539 [Ensete ventricosum]